MRKSTLSLYHDLIMNDILFMQIVSTNPASTMNIYDDCSILYLPVNIYGEVAGTTTTWASK